METALDLYLASREEVIAFVLRPTVRVGTLLAFLESTAGDDRSPRPMSAGRHQYCWAHLLRDGDDLGGEHRDAAPAAAG